MAQIATDLAIGYCEVAYTHYPTFDVMVTITNLGPIEFRGSLPVTVYLCPTQAVNSKSYSVGSYTQQNVDLDLNFFKNSGFLVPCDKTGVPNGSYFLAAFLDPTNMFKETNRANNILFSSTKFTVTGIEETAEGANVDDYRLDQNYPNPFNPTTTIRYGLPQRSSLTLSVFNTLGQKVASLVNETQNAGYHEVKFDGSNHASGVYFYRLMAGSFVQTRKLLLRK